MKTNIRFFLWLIAALFLVSPWCRAEDESLLVHARAFSVTPAVADALLSSADIHHDVQRVLGKIQDLIARKQATVVASPSVQLTVGQRVSSSGTMYLLADVHKDKADYSVVARIQYEDQALQTENHMKRGDTIFMGSFETKSTTTPGTILVFINIQ